MNIFQRTVLAGVAALAATVALAGDPPGLPALVEHLNAGGIPMKEAVHFRTGRDLDDDGFDTLEMVKVMHQDPKTLEVMHAFRLWRQKSVEQTRRRLKMGRLFGRDMTAAGTIVLEWEEWARREEVLKAFESFRKKHKLDKTTE